MDSVLCFVHLSAVVLGSSPVACSVLLDFLWVVRPSGYCLICWEKGCVNYSAGSSSAWGTGSSFCHLASFCVKSQEASDGVRGCYSLLIFAFVSSSQKLAITPVNSAASSTNTTLPTKNTWHCTHPSVSILLEIQSLADCDLLWLNMRVTGESSLWILPRDLWDGI